MSSANIPRCVPGPTPQTPDKTSDSPLQAVGHCFFEWHRFATAITEYQKAWDKLDREKPPCEDAAKKSIESQAAEARKNAAKLRLSLVQEDRKLPDLTITVDGSPQKLDTWPILVYVDPGTHQIEVAARDHVTEKVPYVIPNWQLNTPQADDAVSIPRLRWEQAARLTNLFVDCNANDMSLSELLVTLDGNPISTWPQQVLPGPHRVVVTAPKKLPWDELVTIPEPATRGNPLANDPPSRRVSIPVLTNADVYHTSYQVRVRPVDQNREGLTVRVDGRQSVGDKFDLKAREEAYVIQVSARWCGPWEQKIKITAPTDWHPGDPIPESTLGIQNDPLVCANFDDSRNRLITAGVVTSVSLLMVGAALVGGGYCWEEKLRTSCNNPVAGTGCATSIRESKNASATLIFLGDGLLILGTVAAVLTGGYGTYLNFWAPQPAENKTGNLRLLVAPRPTGANVTLSGEF